MPADYRASPAGPGPLPARSARAYNPHVRSRPSAAALGLLAAVSLLVWACGGGQADPSAGGAERSRVPTAAAPTATATATPEPTPAPTPTFDPGDVILPTVPAPAPSPGPPGGDPDAGLGRIEARASILRQLYALSDPVRRFVTEPELAALVAGRMEGGRDGFAALGRVYEALGVTEPGTDLFELVAGATSAVALGMYDAETGEMFVAGEDPSALSLAGTLTYAHEFVQALQDQHFGTGEVLGSPQLEGNADREAAYRALVVGDAVLAETLYMLNHMTEAEQQQFRAEGPDLSAYLSAPHMVRRIIAFPYSEGAQFVYQFLTDSGWDGVDALYERPPVSTEQVLHPGKYVLGEEPLDVEAPSLEGTLGAGWTEVGRGTLGEFALMAYLEEHLPPADAAEAAAGWGGDGYAVYGGPDGGTLVALRHAWDSEPDAAQFMAAFAAFTLARPGAGTASRLGDGGFEIDLGALVVRAVRRGAVTDIVFAPEGPALEAAADALGIGSAAEPAPEGGGDQ